MTPEQEREVITEAAQRIINDLEAKVRKMRVTNNRLHKRAQAAEAAVAENVDACRRAGVSLGRILANSQCNRLEEQRDRLRAAVDAALVICAEYTETPPPAKPEPCDDACDGYCHHDARLATAARIRDALAPVADPDPHTTSDEETTT